MTIAAIHQPGYFPWAGVIEKIARADIFVVLDNVQFNRAAYQHRTLYSAPGAAKMLTLPVRKAGFLEDGRHIRDIDLADTAAPARHFDTLRNRYRKSAGWRELEPCLKDILSIPREKLMDCTMATLRMTEELFGLNPKLVLASDLNCKGAKSELVINLVKAVGCDTYLSGTGARAYQAPAEFERAGIKLLYQNFRHPRWRQSHGGDFQPGCFALEWALEEGPAAAREGFARHLIEGQAFLTPDQLPPLEEQTA